MKFKSKKIVKVGMIAALYAVLTLSIAPISYGAIQFRLSEILVLLVFFDEDFALGLILGCFISNLYSPLGVIDVIFGTFATFLTVTMIKRSKNLFIASLWPTVFMIIVGIELNFVEHIPFLITTIYLMLGEFVVVTGIGYPLFKFISKNEKITSLLKIK